MNKHDYDFLKKWILEVEMINKLCLKDANECLKLILSCTRSVNILKEYVNSFGKQLDENSNKTFQFSIGGLIPIKDSIIEGCPAEYLKSFWPAAHSWRFIKGHLEFSLEKSCGNIEWFSIYQAPVEVEKKVRRFFSLPEKLEETNE